jgi:hypothetical protein
MDVCPTFDSSAIFGSRRDGKHYCLTAEVEPANKLNKRKYLCLEKKLEIVGYRSDLVQIQVALLAADPPDISTLGQRTSLLIFARQQPALIRGMRPMTMLHP